MLWWYWILLGVLLLIGEMVVPADFYLLFLGLAALAVGAVAGLGLEEPLWVHWVLFSACAVSFVFFFRGSLMARIKSRDREGGEIDAIICEVAILLEDLPPGGSGKGELRGSSWTVLNAHQSPLTKGQRCRVEKVKGLTLWVTPE